jgi:hypothetical protein
MAFAIPQAMAQTSDPVTGADGAAVVDQQGTDATTPVAETQPEPPYRMRSPYQPFDQSLMFTETELLKIRALLAGIDNQSIQQAEEDPEANPVEQTPAPSGPRRIQLSGIAYSSPGRWMIWLNGQRVTPNQSLPEIVELQVYRNYIDLKWFDRYLRKIIKIRMRPNQIYDIANGVMLPG